MSRFRGGNLSSIMRERRRIKDMPKKKRKKEKLLAKITKDGKVKKKEARKLRKKGITERDLQRYDAKAFRRAEKNFEKTRRTRGRNPLAKGPSYSPLRISRGAGRTFGDPRPQRSRPQKQQAKTEPTSTEFTPNYLPTDFDDQGVQEVTTPGGPDTEGPSAEDNFADMLEQLQTSFGDTMTQQQTMFQDMQTAQDERMAALQEQMQEQMQQSMLANQQAMMYNRNRSQVAGVQSAASSAGTPMQIARRGVTGAFGRRGMRISSLNV